MRPALCLALLTALLVAFGAVRPASVVAAEKKRLAYSENGYAILDPAHASLVRTNDERLIVALQDCLTILDPTTGKAVPGAAERWDVADGGRTWTFHLRAGAVWSDGSPVTADDFVRSWQRTMDPFTASEWTPLFRPIKGCATISDNSARTEGFSELRRFLKELHAANPNGIPGERLNAALDDTGVRPYLLEIKSRSVSRMVKWKEEDRFPPEMVDKAVEALGEARAEVKALWRDEFDRFGKAGSGVHASDDHTLVVRTQSDAPYLPELLARSAFAPLHESYEAKRDKAFEPGNYVSSGPFILRGRGARPPENQPNKPTLSVVELDRNPKYAGPLPAQVDEIMCYTDQGFAEDVRRYEAGHLQWVNTTWAQFPQKKEREQVEALKGYGVTPSPRVLYLRFRCDKAPFRERAARKAFALALDREALRGRFWPQAEVATRIVPPGIEGRVEGIAAPAPNLGEAKAAFKEAGLNDDTWIEISYGETPGQDEVAVLLIQGWKKSLGVEPGTRIESEQDVRSVTRSGKFYAMLSIFRGAVNDPYAYLAPLHSGDADSGLGWYDDAFDALVDAARDPDVALADPEGWLKKVGQPQLAGALAGAKASEAGRLKLRHEALAAAEKRLLDEYVVVPLLFVNEATLLGDVKGLGTPEARRNPGFMGSLRTATR